MMRATWNGVVLAESDDTVVLEGNVYFPPHALQREHLQDSATTSRCPWKGTARYYSVVVDDEVNPDAAWYYPDPSRAASAIAGRVAFWHGVRVEELAGVDGGTPGRREPGRGGRLRQFLRR